MLALFKSKRRSILGVDISSTSIKMLELSILGSVCCVEAYASLSLPEHAMEGNSVKDVGLVAETIRTLFSKGRFSCKAAVLAVPDSSSISKTIQINEGLSDQEIEELVVLEADKYIPYPIDEINFDFSVIGPSNKNPSMLDVLVVASRTENVTKRVEAIQQAGLDPKIVDVESFAIERTLQFLKQELPAEGDKKNIAVIDIGSAYTRLFVLHGLKVIFSREEEFGGRQLIDSIMEHFKLSRLEAIQSLEKGSLPPEYESEVLQPFKEAVILQAKRALQFFFSTSHHNFVDLIVLSGGVAKQEGFAQLLQEHVNIPTKILNPFAHMQSSKKIDREKMTHDASMFMVACGLALRYAECG